MAKLTSSPESPTRGRVPALKLGGRAMSPFLKNWSFPSPAKGMRLTTNRRKKRK